MRALRQQGNQSIYAIEWERIGSTGVDLLIINRFFSFEKGFGSGRVMDFFVEGKFRTEFESFHFDRNLKCGDELCSLGH